MREIEFRIWDKFRKTFYQGNYLSYHDRIKLNTNVQIFISLNGEILFFDNDNGQKHGIRQLWSQDDYTKDKQYEVMQYTGLLDKQGKKIYEGDIMSPERYHTKEFNCVVIFARGMFLFKKNTSLIDKIKPLYQSLELALKSGNNYTIIGNIYQNPELLK